MIRRTKLGLGFGETLTRNITRPRNSPDQNSDENISSTDERMLWLKLLFGIGFLILISRAIWIGVIKGHQLQLDADQNRYREEVIRAPRSLIYDRKGKKLTENIPIFRIEERDTFGRLTDYKTISREEALAREANYQPVITDAGRFYPFGAVTMHVLGYINEAGPQELTGNSLTACPVGLGDYVGRSGLEQQYDCLLRGRNGKRILETDTTGRVVRIVGEQQPVMGLDLQTTLDADLQQVAAGALGNKDGAVVALEASTGAILAMVSSPSFDPNLIFGPNANADAVNTALTSPTSPLLNRIIGGAYPAGSIFKMAVAGAALMEKKISPSYTMVDTGSVTVGGTTFYNWYLTEYGGKEGVVDTIRALTRSTDTFFYDIGGLTGPELIAKWAEKFGMGKITGVDVPGEIAGLIPTPAWKLATKGEQWYLGNTYNMAIGQGDVLVSPLQIAQYTQAIADGGTLCRPHLVTDRSAVVRTRPYPESVADNCHAVGIGKDVLAILTRGMVGACSKGGTAFPLFDFKPPVACKTGTAQFGIEGKLTHAWLTAFAPADNPQIVVTALVEGGGEGSAIAAPIAKAVLEQYFRPTVAIPATSSATIR